MSYNFEGKVALVTGATSGIGKEIAKQLLISGAKVIINYGHNEENFEKTKQELRKYEEKVQFVKANIAQEDEVKKMFENIDQLDYLVNNAGTNIDGAIETMNIEDFRKIIDVNLVGKVITTKYAIPLLKNSNGPAIVNIASRLGLMPCEEASAYAITPLALKGWTKEEIEEQKKTNLLKRLGETTDIANAVLFLLSEEASYINGENINVNGGSFMD